MKPQYGLSGIAPIVLSSIVVLILVIGFIVGGLNPLPIHDEDAVDHIAMLMIAAQLPLILYFVFKRRRQLKQALPVLAAQLALLAIIFTAVFFGGKDSRDAVARRIAENTPLPGSEAALRRTVEDQMRDMGWFHDQSLVLLDLANLGPLRSLVFKGVDRIGWDRYDAEFDKGGRELRIFVTPNGRVGGVTDIGDKIGCRSSEPYECR